MPYPDSLVLAKDEPWKQSVSIKNLLTFNVILLGI